MKDASTVDARAVKEAVFEGEELLFGRLYSQKSSLGSGKAYDILDQFATNLVQSMSQDELESLRLKRAKAILSLAKISHNNARLTRSLGRGVAGARDGERSDSVRQILDEALRTLDEQP